MKYRCISNPSCRSSNLIYCITCKICQMQYVLQTSLRLKDRFVHHYIPLKKKTNRSSGKTFSAGDNWRFRFHNLSTNHLILMLEVRLVIWLWKDRFICSKPQPHKGFTWKIHLFYSSSRFIFTLDDHFLIVISKIHTFTVWFWGN